MTGLELLRAIASGEAPGAPIAELMGFEPVEAEDGRVVFEATPTADLLGGQGPPTAASRPTPRLLRVHGGFAATLLDSAMGCAVHSTLPDGVGYTTLELKVNYTRAITKDTGRVLCEGKIVHRGGRVATADGRIVAADSGKLLAHGTTTCLILDGQPG